LLMPSRKENRFPRLKILNSSNCYNLTSVPGGYEFTTTSGDFYFVYFTEFSLLDPDDEQNHIETYSFGFDCKRADPDKKHRFDAGTKATILNILEQYFEEHGEDAFLYICLNTDGMARNRRITFGRWFREIKNEYERHESHIDYGDQDWYSALLVRQDNPEKQRYIDAYHYTLKAMLEDAEEDEDTAG
jgi:hypothetical protein